MPTIKNRSLITTDFHLPYSPQLVARARQMRKNPTPAEKKLWHEFLRAYKPRFLRQRPIDNYIVDFYCAQLRLVIEIDGDTHFTEQGLEYDQQRSHILEGYGLKVIRFTNTEVLENFDAVCSAIEGIPPPPLDKGGYPDSPLSKGCEGGFSDTNGQDNSTAKETSLNPPLSKGGKGGFSVTNGQDNSTAKETSLNPPLSKGGKGGFSGDGGLS
jgi:very-short-patch-repair endonuclease